MTTPHMSPRRWLIVLAAVLAASLIGGAAARLRTHPAGAAEETTAPPALTLVEPTGASIPIRDLPPARSATPIPTPTAIPSPTPIVVDFPALEAALNAYLDERVRSQGFEVGIGLVDVPTGQAISISGEERHYALSTFKGPLAAYYLWQVEHGLIHFTPEDVAHIERMLEVSSNPATTCVIRSVGGLAAFNDWLAYQGMSREYNFVLTWRSWPCEDNGDSYVPDSDLRYSTGDEALGLPGGAALLSCAPFNLRCDKAFAPLELAQFYARLARGEVLDAEGTARWLGWTERERDGSVMLEALPDDRRIHAYVKNGFRAADRLYDQHFYHEAGLIDTGQGVVALAVFMAGNPEWPGTDVIGEIARIVYNFYVGAR